MKVYEATPRNFTPVILEIETKNELKYLFDLINMGRGNSKEELQSYNSAINGALFNPLSEYITANGIEQDTKFN